MTMSHTMALVLHLLFTQSPIFFEIFKKERKVGRGVETAKPGSGEPYHAEVWRGKSGKNRGRRGSHRGSVGTAAGAIDGTGGIRDIWIDPYQQLAICFANGPRLWYKMNCPPVIVIAGTINGVLKMPVSRVNRPAKALVKSRKRSAARQRKKLALHSIASKAWKEQAARDLANPPARFSAHVAYHLTHKSVGAR